MGIPVYVDGLYITLSSGVFEVAKACSGISYLIASTAMGSFFAFIVYKDIKKRFLFIIFAISLPIIANGLRAWIIILLAHYSDMAIATGVDHLIYGWMFFGLIIFIMFQVGLRWEDKDVFKKSSDQTSMSTPIHRGALLSFVACLGVAYLAGTIASNSDAKVWVSNTVIEVSDDVKRQDNIVEPASNFPRADLIQSIKLDIDEHHLGFYGAYYERETADREFISFENTVYDIDRWSLNDARVLNVDGREYRLIEVVDTVGNRFIIAYAYVVMGKVIANENFAKLAMLENKVFNQDASGLFVASRVRVIDQKDAAVKVLSKFIKSIQNQYLSRGK